MGTLSKAAHIGLDLALLSGFLAGVKRNTGLMPNTDKIQNDTVRDYTEKYLKFGDTIYDWSVAYLSSSDYFVRK
ncbi:mitofissin [Diutina rugosa]